MSIIDLSDTDSPQINNFVIAEFLRGLLEAQNENYRETTAHGDSVQRRTMIIIEEAHEFLSAERIKQWCDTSIDEGGFINYGCA